MVRLPCFPGRASDMVVPDDDVIYLECRADKAFALLCRSNDAECLFEAAKHSEGAAILVGRIPWAEGAHLWFISTPRRIVGPAEIAPVLASSDRPALVLFPPGHAVGALDAVLLADARVHLLEMDQYLDWELLELQRLAVLAEMSRQVRSEPGEESQARLVLRVAGCEAFFLGQRLDLRPAEFGFLFAVAETPRATVPHDRIADVVAMVLNRLHSDEYREPDPGPNNKHKSNVVKAFRRLISDDLIPKDSIDPANLIIANKGVGFRLEEGPVLIRK